MILDDVLSTGGTIKALVNGVNESNWAVECAIVLFNKMGDEKAEFERDLGIRVITLLDVEYSGGSYRAVRSNSNPNIQN